MPIGAPDQPTAVRWTSVGIFVALSFLISWSIWIGLTPLIAPLDVRTFLAQVGPTFAAIIVIRLGGGPRRHRNRIGRERLASAAKESLLAILLVVVPVAIGVGLSLASGDLTARAIGPRTIFDIGAPLPLILLIYWVSAFGEEYGWRGYLQPQLKLLGGVRVALVTAVIFGIWHSPAILFQGFDFPRHPIEGIGEILVFGVPFTIVLTWLRSISTGGGVAGPATAHATFNVLGVLTLVHLKSTSNLIAAPLGLLGVVPFALLALWIVLTKRLWPPGEGWEMRPGRKSLETAGIEPARGA